jgi:hypothetical protein
MQGSASRNAANLARILENREGSAVLYRTTVAGPSGQRRQTPIARVAYTYDGPWELMVHDPRTGEAVGYLKRDNWSHAGMWVVHSYCADYPDYELNRLIGWAGSAAIGADVLVNGTYAATGNHDTARTSRATFHRYQPEMADVAA